MRHDPLSRRDLLRYGATTAAAAGLTGLRVFGAPAAQRGGFDDYKALVCVFLYGGADTFNVLVPTSAAEYGVYAASRGDLAEPLASLLPINPAGNSGTDLGGASYGLNGSVPELRDLFEAGRLAFVANVGPLVQPSPKQALLDGSIDPPPSLFSHNDQQAQWQRAWADVAGTQGWAGRMLDQLGAVNGTTPLPPGVSVDQQNLLLVGQETAPYVIGAGGTIALHGTESPEIRQMFQELFAAEQHHLGRAVARTQQEAIAIDDLLSSLLQTAPTFDGLFPETELGAQMRMVARLISLRTQLGVSRQVFFVSAGGFDTHDEQIMSLGPLLAGVSQAVAAFQTSLDQLGEAANVATFSHTEFSRTLSSNGQGSDHGWGGHAFIAGDPVRGRELYGTLPDLTLEGPDDLGEGRIIPTTAVDQLGATLARWFGLTSAQVSATFPNLSRFPTADLGFMG